ncbi:MAG: hypothetical protein ABI216_05045 [Devosia sp.]
MRNPAYLALSRHGIFYFRYPLRPGATLKLSIQTRIPSLALQTARALAVFAHEEVLRLANREIDLEELRSRMAKHFDGLRSKHRERVSERGPYREEELETFESFLELADRGKLLSSWNDVHFESYIAERGVTTQQGTEHHAVLKAEHADRWIAHRRYIVEHDRAIKAGLEQSGVASPSQSVCFGVQV